MSLDITIISPEPIKKKSTGIFARINGETRELTREEAIAHFPDVDPNSIIENEIETDELWHGNITHNLHEMAEHCYGRDFYLNELLWRDEMPDDIIEYITDLLACLFELEDHSEEYKPYNPENGWGTYEQLVKFVRSFIHALIDMPFGSTIEYSR